MSTHKSTTRASIRKEGVIIQNRLRVNEQIRISEIRVIGAEGEQLGVMTPQAALAKARETDLDLVEVAPTSRPPVCRIMDYSKFKYDQEKKRKRGKKAPAYNKDKRSEIQGHHRRA